jgi:signal transduction histidine kinase/ligand-binding sensor domain-containing protein
MGIGRPFSLCFPWSPTWVEVAFLSRVACVLVLASAVALLASILIFPAQAQSQSSQYLATAWQAEQGLPQNSVTAMLQDQLGYLWVGTFGGLARFDGVRFTLFESGDLQHLGDNGILSLFESRSGVLWVGTLDGGLIRVQDGKVTTYTEHDGLPSRFVSSIREDREGNLWFNTSGGVAHFVGRKLESYTSFREKPVREFFLQARDGSKWFRYGENVVRFGADGSVANLKSPKPTSFLVHESRDGSVWIAFRDRYRLVRYYQGVFSDIPLPPIPGKSTRKTLPGDYLVYTLSMAEDAEGELLLLTPAGLCRIANGSLGSPEALPLPSNGRELLKVRSLMVDREGNVWVGTNGLGLVRLRRAPLIAYGKDEGLSDAGFNAVFQDRGGRIWLGGDLLYWFDWHHFHEFTGVANIRAITQTRDGDVWFAGYGGLHRYSSGVLSVFKLDAPDVRAIYQDREGTLWIGALMEEHPGGLYRFRDGKLDQIPGVSDVNQIIGDRDGGIWVSGVKELRYIHGGKTMRYDQKQGLPDRSVDLHLDSTGTLWIASYGGGLTRLRNGSLRTITTKDGLPNNMLAGMLEDSRGNLWISSTQNIFRVSLKELDDLADGKISSVLPVSYGVAEGLRSSESDVGSPAGLETNNGQIWFPTMRGVVAIDPTAGNRVPPPIVVEESWANNVTLARNGHTSVPPGNNIFDFRFTALSFSAPGKLRFKYRLEPFDKDWVDAGTQRTAHYTNMDPGEYSFHVIAVNNYGIWSDQETSVRFVLLPHFYQRNWFRALCVAAFMVSLWAAYQWRVRLLQHDFEMTLEVRIGERTRIARDLHDTLLQSFHGLLLRFQTVSILLPARPTEAKEKLDSAIEQAAGAITEGRDAVQGLRGFTVEGNDLASAISALGEELENDSSNHRPATFRVAVEGEGRDLHPILRDEIYKIAAEALRNAFHHAQAKQVEVEVRYDDDQFRLRVRDDGKGMDAAVLSSHGLEGHYGLRGMRERATLIQGKLAVWSEVDEGTEVELRVPASAAYTTDRKRSWLLQKFAGKMKA